MHTRKRKERKSRLPAPCCHASLCPFLPTTTDDLARYRDRREPRL